MPTKPNAERLSQRLGLSHSITLFGRTHCPHNVQTNPDRQPTPSSPKVQTFFIESGQAKTELFPPNTQLP